MPGQTEGPLQAEAAQSFAVFQQNPDLANILLSLNALDMSLKNRATLIFDLDDDLLSVPPEHPDRNWALPES